MTVSNIEGDKIKIVLSDVEVINYFGTYDELYSMTGSIKSAFRILLQKVLSSRGISFDEEMLVKIRAKKYSGCVIIISPLKNNNKKTPKEYLYSFKNAEELTKGIEFLYNINPNIKSSLYKTENDYRLILFSKNYKPYFLTLNEFSINYSESPYEIAATTEHGKLLISKNAVKTYGNYFFKGI